MRVRRDLAAWSAVAVYAVSAAVCCALAARTSAHFDDLQVYRMSGAAVLHDGGRLYQLRFGAGPGYARLRPGGHPADRGGAV